MSHNCVETDFSASQGIAFEHKKREVSPQEIELRALLLSIRKVLGTILRADHDIYAPPLVDTAKVSVIFDDSKDTARAEAILSYIDPQENRRVYLAVPTEFSQHAIFGEISIEDGISLLREFYAKLQNPLAVRLHFHNMFPAASNGSHDGNDPTLLHQTDRQVC
ncbi:MAG: hypothetical protein HY817_02515 [Candidatus Abawacabacteria bacterium]|nr:hypothetical protein [Candidatus Abawacabacteria bacterium]